MYHSPPNPDVIRIPTLLWKQLYSDICAYLIKKQSGGHKVMTWSHGLIMEMACSRYLTEGNRKQVNLMMAEYFQVRWLVCNSLPNDKILDRSKLKAFADDNKKFTLLFPHSLDF